MDVDADQSRKPLWNVPEDICLSGNFLLLFCLAKSQLLAAANRTQDQACVEETEEEMNLWSRHELEPLVK